MSDYVIVTDAGCDLNNEMLKKFNISLVPLDVKFDTWETSRSSETIDAKSLYDNLRDGQVATTSAANTETFKEKFEGFLKSGKDVLYIGFSSGLSCTCQNAVIAADELKENYPDRKIIVIDTLAASLGFGLLVYKAALLKEKGEDIDAVAKWVEDSKLNMCHAFTVDDLMFLKRGGRVSATTALVGTVLGIKPVLHVDNEGKLINIGKVRGRKASIQELVNMMKRDGYKNTDEEVFISHGDCLDDAKYLAKLVKEQLGFKNITIGMIGPTIGAHSGPGTLALFYFGSKR